LGTTYDILYTEDGVLDRTKGLIASRAILRLRLGVFVRWIMILNRRKPIFICCFLLSAMLLVACGNGAGVSEESSGDTSDIPGEVPQKYRELVNPLTGDVEALGRGTEAYNALCSVSWRAGKR
jgi:hypothetical protein